MPSPSKQKICKDCGVVNDRPVSFPGPRCYTHHVAFKKQQAYKNRLRKVARVYSLTVEQYEKLLDYCPKNSKGDALCMICHKYKARCVDHDHSCCKGSTSCGRCVRGLLCKNCNTILGRMRDDAQAIFRMAEYTEHPPAKLLLF